MGNATVDDKQCPSPNALMLSCPRGDGEQAPFHLTARTEVSGWVAQQGECGTLLRTAHLVPQPVDGKDSHAVRSTRGRVQGRVLAPRPVSPAGVPGGACKAAGVHPEARWGFALN